MQLPEGWKEALLAEMDRRFRICDEKGRLHDDALATDDTQIGVEFAIDFISSLPQPTLICSPEEAMKNMIEWGIKYKKLREEMLNPPAPPRGTTFYTRPKS